MVAVAAVVVVAAGVLVEVGVGSKFLPSSFFGNAEGVGIEIVVGALGVVFLSILGSRQVQGCKALEDILSFKTTPGADHLKSEL